MLYLHQSYIVADKFGNAIGRKVDVIETPFVLEVDEMDDSVYKSLLEGKKYVLFFGSLVEHKGICTIAESIYEILLNNPDLYFVLIGNGDLHWIYDIRQNGKEYAERILYHPAIGFSQLVPVIKNAEAVVLPSLMENFSNACVETMALGQIVLGCEGASFEQLITDGKNGALCKIGDSDSFVKKVNEILGYSENQKWNMRKNAKETLERLNPEIVTKHLLEYYEKVVNEYKDNE